MNVLQVTIQWKVSNVDTVQALCDTFDVIPIPPDPVNNVSITFQEAFPQGNQHFVTLRYTWTPPSFEGEGVTGYQVWLEETPAPQTISQRLQQLAADCSSANTQAGF